jgi:YVTN family beta-propeller protein
MCSLHKPANASIVLAGGILAGLLAWFASEPNPPVTQAAESAERDRSPVDLVVTPDGKLIVTANQTSNSVSVVQAATGKVMAEIPCGRKPAALALTPDGKRVLVTASDSGDLTIIEVEDEKLTALGKVQLGFDPRGVTVAPTGKVAFVALSAAGEVAVVDLDKKTVAERIPVGRWPRTLALSPDGRRLGVGVSGDGGIAVVDTEARKRLYLEDFVGLNLGQLQATADGKYVYFPWVTSRQMSTTAGNIRQGWVLGSRIARVRLDGPARREAMTLDPSGKAVADPFGLALSPDEKWLVCTASGTHELLVIRTEGLPLQDYGGPGDHIRPELSEGSRSLHAHRVGRPAHGGPVQCGRPSRAGCQLPAQLHPGRGVGDQTGARADAWRPGRAVAGSAG